MEKKLPEIKSFKTKDGKELRELFALSVMRALTPMERNQVLKALETPL